MHSLSLLYSFIIHGKIEYLNVSVLQKYVVMFLVFRVLYKWYSEGFTQLNKMEFHYFNLIEVTHFFSHLHVIASAVLY